MISTVHIILMKLNPNLFLAWDDSLIGVHLFCMDMTQHGLLFDLIHYPIFFSAEKDGSRDFHPLFILFLTFMSSVSQRNTYFSLNNQEVLKNDSFFSKKPYKVSWQAVILEHLQNNNFLDSHAVIKLEFLSHVVM